MYQLAKKVQWAQVAEEYIEEHEDCRRFWPKTWIIREMISLHQLSRILWYSSQTQALKVMALSLCWQKDLTDEERRMRNGILNTAELCNGTSIGQCCYGYKFDFRLYMLYGGSSSASSRIIVY